MEISFKKCVALKSKPLNISKTLIVFNLLKIPLSIAGTELFDYFIYLEKYNTNTSTQIHIEFN